MTLTRHPGPRSDAPAALGRAVSQPRAPLPAAGWQTSDPATRTGTYAAFRPQYLVTAEYPVLGPFARSAPAGGRVGAPVGPVGRPSGRPPRRSAPLGLRLVVGLLYAVFSVVACGLVLLYSRPALFSWAARPIPAAPSAPIPHAVATSAPAAFAATVAPGAIGYRVPSATYSISFDIANPCWVLVKQVASGKTLLAETLQPGRVPPLQVSGSTTVEVAARTAAITIARGSLTLGVIPHPSVGATYELVALSRTPVGA